MLCKMNVFVDDEEERRKVVGRGKRDELIRLKNTSEDVLTGSPAVFTQCRYPGLLSLTAVRSPTELSEADRANSPVGTQLRDPSRYIYSSKDCVYPFFPIRYCSEASIQLLDSSVVHVTSPNDPLLQVFTPEDTNVHSYGQSFAVTMPTRQPALYLPRSFLVCPAKTLGKYNQPQTSP